MKNSIESAGEKYDAAHERARELLGEQYDQDKLDAIAVVNGWDKVLKELEIIGSEENPEQRTRIADNWYAKHSEDLETFTESK